MLDCVCCSNQLAPRGSVGYHELTLLNACWMIIWRSVLGILGNKSLMAASAWASMSSCLWGMGSGREGFASWNNSWFAPSASRAFSTMDCRIWWPTLLRCVLRALENRPVVDCEGSGQRDGRNRGGAASAQSTNRDDEDHGLLFAGQLFALCGQSRVSGGNKLKPRRWYNALGELHAG